MKKMLFSLFAAVMAVSFIACANSSDGGSSDPEKKGSKGGDDPVVTETYTVTYDDGVAEETITVPSDSKEYAEGDTVTVKFTGIGSRDDYTFTGWSDGTRTYTKDGTKSFTMPAQNVTLTAQWEENYNFSGTSWKYVTGKAGNTWTWTITFDSASNKCTFSYTESKYDEKNWEKVGTYSYNGEANSVTIRFSDEEEDRTFTYDFEAEIAYLSGFNQGFSLIEVKE